VGRASEVEEEKQNRGSGKGRLVAVSIKKIMKEKSYRGEVILWNQSRQFGFIQSKEMLPFGEHQIFVHQSNASDPLFLGAVCTFEIGLPYRVGRKEQAVNVTCKNAAGLRVLSDETAEVIQ
jgi:cold shock CspA family protein